VSNLAQVELLWLEKRIENWIRFGRHVEEQVLDKQRRILSRGSIFAFVCWTSNDLGTVVSRIDILGAVAPGQRCATVPYVRPGGDILLRLSGWPKVERVLQFVDAVEALGIDPADAAPDYWHHVHNRLTVNEVPWSYTRASSGLAASAKALAMNGRVAAFLTAVDRPAVHDRDQTGAALHMERFRERAHGPVPAAARRQTVRHGTCCGTAARTPRNIPRRSPVSAARHSHVERVLALPEQTVCRDNLTITVDKIEIGEARERDSSTRLCRDTRANGRRNTARWKTFTFAGSPVLARSLLFVTRNMSSFSEHPHRLARGGSADRAAAVVDLSALAPQSGDLFVDRADEVRSK
jgi:hypothetical protein